MTEPNHTQRSAWNGDSGYRWIADPDQRDHVLADTAAALALAGRVQPGEHVLDIGCGCGATTLAAARAAGPEGTVLGLDISEPMLSVAQTRLAATPLNNVTLRLADVQTDELPAAIHNIAISRFGTMFFDDPIAAFTNIAASLRAGGRLCIATWQPLSANPWLAIPGAELLRYGTLPDTTGTAPGMFAQSDPAVIHATLTAAGFTDIDVAPIDVTMHLGGNPTDASAYLTDTGIARTVLETIAPHERDGAIAAVISLLGQYVGPNGVSLGAGIWLTSATVAPYKA